MVDSVEMQDIRGLDIDKMVKGFALTEYIFKNLVTVSSTTGDSIRWYQETAADLTTTQPQQIETSPLSSFPNLEVTWTRQVSYPRKYAVSGFISREDIKSADIDVLARSILRLTRAVVKKVDRRIYDVLTDSQTPATIQTGAASAVWSSAAATIIGDIMSGVQAIQQYDYDTSGYIIAMTPKNHKEMMQYLIETKGSSIPGFSSDAVNNSMITGILGGRVVVSNNVVADSVFVGLPAKAVTWKSFEDIHAETEEVKGVGTKILIWENGEAILTDPKASYLITNTD